MNTTSKVAVVVTVGLLLSACGSSEPEGGAAPPVSVPVTSVPVTPVQSTLGVPSVGLLEPVGGPMYEAGALVVADYLGRPLPDFEEDVAALGFGPVRLAWQDGEYLDLTEDLVVGRVNVAVETRDGESIVVDAFVENDPETDNSTPEATIVEVAEGVTFYPACGNEQLTHDGQTWYQVQRVEYPEIYDRAVNGYRENLPETVTTSGFAPRVGAPGPGDDVGTLVIWSDDVAYFVSDSGDLTAWLVREELTYRWEC